MARDASAIWQVPQHPSDDLVPLLDALSLRPGDHVVKFTSDDGRESYTLYREFDGPVNEAAIVALLPRLVLVSGEESNGRVWGLELEK